MLSDRTRNYIVGLTMVAAIAAFMIAVFQLTNVINFLHGRPYTVVVTAPEAAGVAAGTTVNFNDVPIGVVSNIVLANDMTRVELTLAIHPTVRIPANAVVILGKPPTIGAAYVKFKLPDGAPGATAATSYLATDGTARIAGEAVDSSLIPKKTTDTLTAAANALNELLAKHSLAEFNAQDPKTRTANISILVQEINQAVDDVHGLIGDPKLRDQIHLILDNVSASSNQLSALLAQAGTSLKSANANIDTLSAKFGASADQISAAATQATSTLHTTEVQIIHTAEELSASLSAVQTMLADINKGKGTAGQLINDPRLYDGLIDLTTSLKKTSDDLNTLIQKWKEEGLPLHLK